MSLVYDRYIKTHKENVHEAFKWLKEHLPENLIPEDLMSAAEYQCQYNHDTSKTTPEEYYAYDNYFYGNRSFEICNEFDYAWLHHIHHNPHHWQYWILINDDKEKGEKILEIPDNYIIEMICDWWSFSWLKGNGYEIFDWYDGKKEYMKIHPNSQRKIENILAIMKNKLNQGMRIGSQETLEYATD